VNMNCNYLLFLLMVKVKVKATEQPHNGAPHKHV